MESQPHIEQPAIRNRCAVRLRQWRQERLRRCTVSCGDIDLEKSYWEGIADPARRNVYYMFFGLIVGFYGYYYLYSGTWSYYFSGIWTHESDQLSAIMKPGLFIESPIMISELVAVPLVLGVAVTAALGLGKAWKPDIEGSAGHGRTCPRT